MARALTLNVSIAALVFWALITWTKTGGFSIEGFKETGFQTVIFVILYAAISVAMILFKGGKK